MNKMRMLALTLCAVFLFMTGAAFAEQTTVYKMGQSASWQTQKNSTWHTHNSLPITESYIQTIIKTFGKNALTATCTEPGKLYVDCYEYHYYGSLSGSVKCNEYKWVSIEALGHKVSAYTPNNDATCAKNGTQSGQCERCGETVTVEIKDSKKQHSFTVYKPDRNVNCTDPGTETAVCDNGCGATDTRVGTIDPNKHVWGGWVSNRDDTHSRACTLNKMHPIETKSCHGGKATAQNRAVCDDCGDYYGELAPAIPQTGDRTNLILWFAMLAVSVIGIFHLRFKAGREN